MHDTGEAHDAWLAARCKLGERGAWEDVVKRHDAPIRYFVGRIAASRADDVMQEAWMRAFKSIKKLEDGHKLRPWLYQIARRSAVDLLRQETALSAKHDLVSEEELHSEVDFDRFDAESVHKGLARIGWNHAEVLTLFFLDELTMGQISEVLEIPLGTVKSRLFHAKKQLKTELEEMGYGDG